MNKRLTVSPGRLIKDEDVYTISKTTVRDSGHYTCKAVNEIGTSIQKSTWRFLSHGEYILLKLIMFFYSSTKKIQSMASERCFPSKWGNSLGHLRLDPQLFS